MMMPASVVLKVDGVVADAGRLVHIPSLVLRVQHVYVVIGAGSSGKVCLFVCLFVVLVRVISIDFDRVCVLASAMVQ